MRWAATLVVVNEADPHQHVGPEYEFTADGKRDRVPGRERLPDVATYTVDAKRRCRPST